AGDIKTTSNVEVVNPEQVIATISDKKTEFEMEIEIDKGLGYLPAEQRDREEREIGVIAIDAIYTPVKRVNYEVENMRVGKRTDFDKITLEVLTDGSITPEQAFQKSVSILVNQFQSLVSGIEEEVVEAPKKAKAVRKKKAEVEVTEE
ncbi:MAG: DNA-directed RNA polymerase subunit alpha, partial [Patescibacteria group bacterium]